MVTSSSPILRSLSHFYSRYKWQRAWRLCAPDCAPGSVKINGDYPVLSFEFKTPPGFSTKKIEVLAEKIALQMSADWFEINRTKKGWKLLLDMSPEGSYSPPLPPPFDSELKVNLGSYADRTRALWDLTLAPHLLIAGATGSGKSSLLRTIIASLPYGFDWKIFIIDPKEIDFTPVKDLLSVLTLKQTPELLTFLDDTLEYRKDVLASQGVSHWLDCEPNDFYSMGPILCVIDEAADVFSGVGFSKAEQVIIKETLSKIARQGRACGVHLLLSFTRPDVSVIDGATRDQFSGRIALGKTSPDGARMIFGTAPPALSKNAPGTGLSMALDGDLEIRRINTCFSTLDDVKCRWT